MPQGWKGRDHYGWAGQAESPEIPDHSRNSACQKQPSWCMGITVNHHCGLRIGTNFTIISYFSEQQEDKWNTVWAAHWENARWLCRFGPRSGWYLGHTCTYPRGPVYIIICVNALFESHIIDPPKDPSKQRDATMSIICKVYRPKVIVKCLWRALWFPGSRFIFLVMFCSS